MEKSISGVLRKIDKRKCMVLILLDLLFGISCVLTPIFGEGAYKLGVSSLFIFFGGAIIFLLVFGLLCLIINFFHKKSKFDMVTINLKSNVFLGVFTIASIIGGLVYLIVFYPGTGMYDTLYILKSEGFGVAIQHPWLYCFLIQKLVDVVQIFGGDYEAALVVEAIIQILIISFTYLYCIKWLMKKKVSKIAVMLVAGYFLLCPILNLYKITLFKDVPFSIILVLWLPFLYEVWETNGESLEKTKNICGMGILIILSLLRNNGIYISFFILIVVLFLYRKKWKRILILGVMLCCVVLGNQMFEKHEGITHLFKETVGIPLQQIAATVYYDGNINEEQYAFIDKVMPIEFIKEKYNPYSADSLKWGESKLDNDYLRENKVKFMKTWLELCCKNFKIYVRAYLYQTYGFWSVDNSDSCQIYTSINFPAFEEWIQENDISIKSILPSSIQNKAENFLSNISRSFGAGIWFWLFVEICMVLYWYNDGKVFIVATPAIGAWLTLMISVPVAWQWRYILYIPMMLPLLYGINFKEKLSVTTIESKVLNEQ